MVAHNERELPKESMYYYFGEGEYGLTLSRDLRAMHED
jgi:hypothetical protein